LPLTNDGGQPRIGNDVERVTIVGDIVSPAPRFRQDADVFRCGGSGIWKNPGVPFVPASQPTVDAMCGLMPALWPERRDRQAGGTPGTGTASKAALASPSRLMPCTRLRSAAARAALPLAPHAGNCMNVDR